MLKCGRLRKDMSITEEDWRTAHAEIGELVVLYTVLDHQLNHIVMGIARVAESPMVEAVIATLDPRQKIEILKARADHMQQADWKKGLKTHADRLERVARVRNMACHVPLVANEAKGILEFAPAAAVKLMKSMTIVSREDYSVERQPVGRVKEAIELGQKAFGGGQYLISKLMESSKASGSKS